MSPDSPRPLTWTILSQLRNSLKKGAAESVERRSGESADREQRDSNRSWWSRVR